MLANTAPDDRGDSRLRSVSRKESEVDKRQRQARRVDPFRGANAEGHGCRRGRASSFWPSLADPCADAADQTACRACPRRVGEQAPVATSSGRSHGWRQVRATGLADPWCCPRHIDTPGAYRHGLRRGSSPKRPAIDKPLNTLRRRSAAVAQAEELTSGGLQSLLPEKDATRGACPCIGTSDRSAARGVTAERTPVRSGRAPE